MDKREKKEESLGERTGRRSEMDGEVKAYITEKCGNVVNILEGASREGRLKDGLREREMCEAGSVACGKRD